MASSQIDFVLMNSDSILTKDSLKQLHEEQLASHGQTSNEQKDAIIDALGGIDELLQCIWESDITLNDAKLDALQNIIGNKQMNEDQDRHAYAKTIQYKFNDDDMILYKLFNEERAIKLHSILKSHGIFIFVTMQFVMSWIISEGMYYAKIISAHTRNTWWVMVFPFPILYLFGLITCANIAALKMLLREFVFWFKLFYLLTFVVADLYFVSLDALIFVLILIMILAMLTDALNISQASKIFLTTCAAGIFMSSMITCRQISFNRDNELLYVKSSIVIPSVLGFNSIHINMIDIEANAAQVLALFAFKQLFAAIRKPDKATIMKISPKLVFTDQTKQPWSRRKLNIFKNMLIGLLILAVVYCVLYLISYGEKILIAFILIGYLVPLYILLCIGSQKALYVMNAFILSSGALVSFGCLFFGWNSFAVLPASFLFGLLTIYTIAVAQSNGEHDDDEDQLLYN